MKINYFKTLLAIGALTAASTAMADGTWRNINYRLQNPAFIPGWSGALTATADGVAETYNGAFELYQVLPDMPAGEYTLTANAFHRPGRMNIAEDVNTFLMLGDEYEMILGLAEGGDLNAHNTWEANQAFENGRFLNTLTINHEGGDLKLGIVNFGTSESEWVCFDNFKLVGPEGDVEIPNGDFAEGLNADKNQTIWDCANVELSNKAPDVNKAGGVYRKTNASPYNFGQQVELPAGTYRWGVQSFLRHGGSGNDLHGQYITCKGAWGYVDGESALDRHENATEAEEDNAYLYVAVSEFKPSTSEDLEYTDFYVENPIKCIFDEDLEVYPDNEPSFDGETAEGYGWCDSGFEYQAAQCFVLNRNLYRNYVEFTLAEPTTVWVGFKKDRNAPTQFWNPFRDFTLEVFDTSTSVEGVAAAANTVEYFNLQGVRVANPTEGIFVVREGNKVSKKVF